MSELKKLAGPVAIALLCAGLLTLTNALTGPRINANYQAAESSLLQDLLGAQVSREALENATWEDNHLDFCTLGLVVSRFATPGYAGAILGLVAWRPDQTQITGIRITRQLETPGIADFLNDRSDEGWLNSLLHVPAQQLQQLDTVSGATISSAAVQRGMVDVLNGADAAMIRCGT